MVDRHLLRYFLAIVDHGTFTAAARHCRVSQPTLSEGISKLEQLMQRVLLERTNRRVQLTAAGARFAVHARRIEAEFLEVEHEVHTTTPMSTLRLGLTSSLSPAWIEPALKAACLEREERVEIIEARAGDLPTLLDRGRIDAAIGLRMNTNQLGETLWTEGYGLALPVAHRLADASCIAAEQVASETMFVRRDCEVLAEVSRFFTSRGVRPFMSARTMSEERAITYVRAGLGITVMPRSFLTQGIVIIPMAGFTTTRSMGLLVDTFQHDLPARSKPLMRLLDALRTVADRTLRGNV